MKQYISNWDKLSDEENLCKDNLVNSEFLEVMIFY